MVMFILILLMSLVLVAAGSNRKTANRKATEALMTRITAALEEYKDLTGGYPPDGYDEEVLNDQGNVIRGSACLHYFLTRELTLKRKVSGKLRIRKVEPLLELSDNLELAPKDGYEEGVREIVDAFGVVIWYDNTQNRKFEPLEEPGHPDADTWPSYAPDPRIDASMGAVKDEGLQGDGYDIWSYAEGNHNQKDDLRAVIGSWNLGKRADDEEEAPGDE